MRVLFFLMLLSLVLISCKEEGCTDPDAINFNEDAGKDDSSCQFVGYVSFYLDEEVMLSLEQSEISTLLYFLDNTFIDAQPIDIFLNDEPHVCGLSGMVNTSIDLGTSASKTVEYRIKDQWGTTIFFGELDLTSNQCEIFPVGY